MVGNKQKKRDKKLAKQQAKLPVATPVTTPTKPQLTKVFIYDNLNVHEVQRDIWKEAKQGVPFTLFDYELKTYEDGIQYIEKMMGEKVAGKLYELDEDQLKNTDWYENEDSERIRVNQTTDSVFTALEIYVPIKKSEKK